jgi:hypothetical protein
MPSLDFIWLSPKAPTRYKQQDSHPTLSYHTTCGALGAKHPIAEAAAWINRYSKYWDSQFKTLAHHLLAIENRRSAKKP